MSKNKKSVLIVRSQPTGTIFVPVTEQSQVGEARRSAIAAADDLGFDEVKRSEVAIVVTELATNLLKHTTKGGGLLMQMFVDREDPQLEVVSLDRGSGIASLNSAMSDGFSTAGSLGTGLGAVQRMSNSFEIYSEPGKGTAIVTRHCRERAEQRQLDMPAAGAISVPYRGEQVCGDGWLWLNDGNQNLLLLADGLGHGTYAAEAANEAMDAAVSGGIKAPSAVLELVHSRLKSTRGAAVSVAVAQNGKLSFAGLGNVAGAICRLDSRQQMVSHDGTAGFEAKRIREYDYEVPDSSIIVMHSDGCSKRWNLDNYPGIFKRSASLIASVLFRDSAKGTDDATVLVFKS